MTITALRKKLQAGRKDTQLTHVLKPSIRGKFRDLGSYTVTAFVKKDLGTGTAYTPTITVPTQSGEDFGVVEITHASTDLDESSTYYMDVLIAESGGNAEPVMAFFEFPVYDKETE